MESIAHRYGDATDRPTDAAFWEELGELERLADTTGVPAELDARWDALLEQRAAHMPSLDRGKLAALRENLFELTAAESAQHTWLTELWKLAINAEHYERLRWPPRSADDENRARVWKRVGVQRCTCYTERERMAWRRFAPPIAAYFTADSYGARALRFGSELFVFVGGRYLGPYSAKEAHAVLREAFSLENFDRYTLLRLRSDDFARGAAANAIVIDGVEAVAGDPSRVLPVLASTQRGLVLQQPGLVLRDTRRTQPSSAAADWLVARIVEAVEAGSAWASVTISKGKPVISIDPACLRSLPGAPVATIASTLKAMSAGQRARPRGAGRSANPLPCIPVDAVLEAAGDRREQLDALVVEILASGRVEHDVGVRVNAA